jgi:hypothetical protein
MTKRICRIVLSLALAVGAARTASAAEEQCPIKWHTLKTGMAAAKSRNRPIVMVFTQGGSRSHDWFTSSFKTAAGQLIWRHVATLNDANVVLIKVPPPTRLKLTAGASAQQLRLLQAAHKKLLERYRKLTTRYGVTRIPTALFLSPDGEMVFKSYARKSESTVISALKHMHQYFSHYQQARALMASKSPAKVNAAVPFGPADARDNWYTSMPQAIAAAKAKDRPIVAIFTQTGSRGTDWFGCNSGIAGGLTWSHNTELKQSGALLVKIAPPTKLRLVVGTPYAEITKLRAALKKMTNEYAKWARKYGVYRIPSVRFLSPDGEMVLKSYNRKSQSLVISGLKNMKKLFADYKQMREMLKEAAAEDEKKKPKKKPASGVKGEPKGDF